MVAAVVVAEAGGEGPRGMMAVAEVIRTRADAADVSMLTIVQRARAFSVLNTSSLEDLYWKYSGQNVYTQALAMVRVAYNTPEVLPGLTKGANHYFRIDAHPSWARNRRPIIVIGNHAFYRL